MFKEIKNVIFQIRFLTNGNVLSLYRKQDKSELVQNKDKCDVCTQYLFCKS